MPFGGKYQLTPSDGMAAKVPVLGGETNTATVMTFGYNPDKIVLHKLNIYAKPEDDACYYTINGDFSGHIKLYE